MIFSSFNLKTYNRLRGQFPSRFSARWPEMIKKINYKSLSTLLSFSEDHEKVKGLTNIRWDRDMMKRLISLLFSAIFQHCQVKMNRSWRKDFHYFSFANLKLKWFCDSISFSKEKRRRIAQEKRAIKLVLNIYIVLCLARKLETVILGSISHISHFNANCFDLFCA